MPAPDPEMLRQLAVAVELRAAGNSWEAVAARLDRSPDTVRRWPTHYRAEWDELYRAAERGQLTEARAEATAVLRTQLRLDDTKEKRDAAKALLAAASRDRAGESPSSDPTITRLVESTADDKLPDLEATTDAILNPDAAD